MPRPFAATSALAFFLTALSVTAVTAGPSHPRSFSSRLPHPRPHSKPTPAPSPTIIVLDDQAFPVLPAPATSQITRPLLRRLPLLGPHLYWGCYGGPGNDGGPPDDALDELFRRHDLAYLKANTMEEIRAADRTLIAALEAIAPTALSPEARRYRARALRAFKSPLTRALAHPLDIRLGLKHLVIVTK